MPWGKDLSSTCRDWVITLIPSPWWAVLIFMCMYWEEKVSMVLASLVVTISSESPVVWLDWFTIFYCSCSLLHYQKIGHSGVYPRHLFLFYHIYDTTYCRSPQNNRHSYIKIWQDQDYQGYLVPFHNPGLCSLEPVWWCSLKVGSMHHLGLHRQLICLLNLSGTLHQGNAPLQNLG